MFGGSFSAKFRTIGKVFVTYVFKSYLKLLFAASRIQWVWPAEATDDTCFRVIAGYLSQSSLYSDLLCNIIHLSGSVTNILITKYGYTWLFIFCFVFAAVPFCCPHSANLPGSLCPSFEKSFSAFCLLTLINGDCNNLRISMTILIVGDVDSHWTTADMNSKRQTSELISKRQAADYNSLAIVLCTDETK